MPNFVLIALYATLALQGIAVIVLLRGINSGTTRNQDNVLFAAFMGITAIMFALMYYYTMFVA